MGANPPKTTTPKPPSTKPSIVGGIFSILALMSAGVAHFLTHSESRSHTTVTTAVGTVRSGPIAHAASKTVTGILSLPFIVVAICFALLALLLTMIRLRKVKVAGLFWSIVWVLLGIWSISLAVGALTTLKAHPAS
ncbi:MAG: hypothetical protein ACREGB_02160 [Candidatus Saccharimonadales bacterium]